MSSVQAPHDWLTSDYGSYDLLNTNRDALQQLQGQTPTGGQGALDFVSLVQATAQTGLASGWNAVTFLTTSEVIDSAGSHSVSSNTSRIVGKTAGYFEFGGVGAFAASASGTVRAVELRLNGTPIAGTQVSTDMHLAGNSTCLALPSGVWVQMNGTTDYVEMFMYADFASWATTVSTSSVTRFSGRWVHV